MFAAVLLGYFLLKRNLNPLTVLFNFRNWFKLSLTKISSNSRVIGVEFRSFTSLLAQNGIIHRVTCSHTLEQNGIVKRKHRYTVEVRLKLFDQARLPLKYWDYSFSGAVHLINLLPTSIRQHKFHTWYFMVLLQRMINFACLGAIVIRVFDHSTNTSWNSDLNRAPSLVIAPTTNVTNIMIGWKYYCFSACAF